MKAYKGFNKDMTCRGFQYEIGKTYETDEADLCNSGFHACENPLDCFKYYSPAKSKYFEVEIEDNGQRHTDDSKVVGKKIKIGAELSVAQICKIHFDYVKKRCIPTRSTVAGDRESASAGEYGIASAGYGGSASAGWYGVSASRGSADVGGNGVAVVRGYDVKAKGGIGSVLVVAIENENDNNIKEWKAAVVDGVTVKADTYYTLKNGVFAEAQK